MAVRSFTPTSLLVCSIGGLASNNSGANTWAVLLKRNAAADQGVMTLHDSGAALRNGHIILASGSNNELGYQSNAGGTPIAGMQILTTDGWLVAALTKAAGTVAPRGHKCILSGANTHTNATSNVADHAVNDLASGSVRFGGGTFGDFNGYIAAAGVLNSVLSDANIESLKTAWANWTSLFTGANAGLWRFDQAVTTDPVNDQTGNGANQSSLTGTSVVTGNDPPSFDWGGGPPPVSPGFGIVQLSVPAGTATISATSGTVQVKDSSGKVTVG